MSAPTTTTTTATAGAGADPISEANTTSLHPALLEQGIVPDILPSLPTGTQILGIEYGDHVVSPGEAVERKLTLEAPKVMFTPSKWEAEGTKGEYVLIMVDPDLFTTNDSSGQVRHWLATITFPSSPSSTSNAPGTITHEFTPYLPCTPGLGSGHHRYIFILASQSASTGPAYDLGEGFVTSHAPDEDLKDRMGFYAHKYVQDKGLKVVAINHMKVAADAKSAVQNIGAGVQAVAHKLTGK